MKKLVALAVVLVAFVPALAAQTATSFTGKWEGTFKMQRPDGSEGNPQDVVFDLTQKGKVLTGLKVVRIDRDGMDFTASLMRNLPVAAPFLLNLLPVIGPFLAYTVGIAILLIETYLGFYDPDGQRAGDTFAETLVVEYRQGSDGVPLSDRRA